MVPGTEGNFSSSLPGKASLSQACRAPQAPVPWVQPPGLGNQTQRRVLLCCLPYLWPSCRHGSHSSQPSIWGPHLPEAGPAAPTSSPVRPCLNVLHYRHHTASHPTHETAAPQDPPAQFPPFPRLLFPPGNILPMSLSRQAGPKAACSRKPFRVCWHDPLGPGGHWTVALRFPLSPWARACPGSHPA